MKSGKKATNARRSGRAKAGKFRTGVIFILLACIGVMLAVIIFMLPEKNNTGPNNAADFDAAEDPADDREYGDRSTGTDSKGTIEAILTSTIKKPGRIAIVIDDAGNDSNSLLPFLKFPGKITIAVLPQLPHSTASATLAHEAGKEVILHLPMQPVGEAKTGPGAILITQDKKVIRDVLELDLKSVPFVSGVNNHMGSLAMQDEKVLEALFELLKEKRLFFLDSRTTAGTLGEKYAGQFQVPFIQRKIFLDSQPTRENIEKNLAAGVDYARLSGSAVLIGHVQNRDVIKVLLEQYDMLVASGIKFVEAGDLLATEGSKP
ncbi:MAG: divergent polysaccharide deacetylase family protein [Spirochaetaceae bacterium]|nr:MAG: divergent polysaccharide deacetylase family protein [Spirochaetaceae bacterium]